MSEFLPGVDVREMDFDRSHSAAADGVPEGDAGVGVRGCVEDEDVPVLWGLLDPGHEFPFVVGLPEFDDRLQFLREGPDVCLDVSQGQSSVDSWLSRAEQVEIRTVQEEDAHSGTVARCGGFLTLKSRAQVGGGASPSCRR